MTAAAAVTTAAEERTEEVTAAAAVTTAAEEMTEEVTAAAAIATAGVEDDDQDPLEAITVGMSVKADFMNHGTWYSGTVTRIREDGTSDVRYADGDFEACIPRENLQTYGMYCLFACLHVCMFVCLLVCTTHSLTHSLTHPLTLSHTGQHAEVKHHVLVHTKFTCLLVPIVVRRSNICCNVKDPTVTAKC